jgi:hypothetical protein
MNDEHRRYRACGRAALSVASVGTCWPGEDFSEAILAHAPATKEEATGADQAVVVQSLHHRHPFGCGRMVSRRGNEG